MAALGKPAGVSSSASLHLTSNIMSAKSSPARRNHNVSRMRWVRVHDRAWGDDGFPPGLIHHSMTLVNDKMWVFGGCDGEGKCLNEVFVFDVECLCWAKKRTSGTPPMPRKSHTATLVGRRLYVFGGCDQNGNLLNDLHCLHTETLHWETLDVPGPHRPLPRHSHAAIAHDNHLLIHGGDAGDSGLLNDMYILPLTAPQISTSTTPFSSKSDAATPGHTSAGWVQVAAMPSEGEPTPRMGHTVTLVGTVMVVFGGIGEDGKVLGDAFAVPLVPLLGLLATKIGNGRSGPVMATASTSVSSLAPQISVDLRRRSPSSTGSVSTTSTVTPRQPFITPTQPRTSSTNNPLRTSPSNFFFPAPSPMPTTLTWTYLPMAPLQPPPRYHHATCLVGNHLFIHGGLSGQNEPSVSLALVNLHRLVAKDGRADVSGNVETMERAGHALVHHRSRVFCFGGRTGEGVVEGMWALELAGSAYLPYVPVSGVGSVRV
ncbi:hypothetical protein BC829DRAFT_215050 [Chytridium lagenaria]|nr:hypothetical protein BC829DRAFT_215050 [Chytridium lagenaria]